MFPKRLFFIVFGLLFGVDANSQNRSFWELGSSLTLNHLNTKVIFSNGNSESVEIISKQSQSYSIALGYGFEFKSGIFLQTGMTFNQYKSVLNFATDENDIDIPMKLNYLLSLPLLVGYKLGLTKKERLYLVPAIGFDLSFNGIQSADDFILSGQFSMGSSSENFEYYYKNTFAQNNLFNPFLFLDGNLSLEYAVSPKFFLNLNAGLHVGFRQMHAGLFSYLNTDNSTDQQVIETYGKGNYSAFGFKAKYYLGKNK